MIAKAAARLAVPGLHLSWGLLAMAGLGASISS